MTVTKRVTDNSAEKSLPRRNLFSRKLLSGYSNIDMSKLKTSGINILLASLSIVKTNTTASRMRANLA